MKKILITAALWAIVSIAFAQGPVFNKPSATTQAANISGPFPSITVTGAATIGTSATVGTSLGVTGGVTLNSGNALNTTTALTINRTSGGSYPAAIIGANPYGLNNAPGYGIDVNSSTGIFHDQLVGAANLISYRTGQGASEYGYSRTWMTVVPSTGAVTLPLTFYLSALTAASGTPSSICQNAATKEVTINAALTCTVSSASHKNHIDPLDRSGTQMLAKLVPVKFFYNDNDRRLRYGLVAEQLAAVDPQLAEWDKGKPNSIDFPALFAVMIKTAQEQEAVIKTLLQRVTTLETAAEERTASN